MRLNEFDSYQWRIDVESFARWRGFYDACLSRNTKDRALKQLRHLQERWPHHKLGDMPKEIAA